MTTKRQRKRDSKTTEVSVLKTVTIIYTARTRDRDGMKYLREQKGYALRAGSGFHWMTESGITSLAVWWDDAIAFTTRNGDAGGLYPTVIPKNTSD